MNNSVVIIDDQSIDRDIIEKMILSMDLNTTCMDSRSAISFFEEQLFAILIVDIVMPDIDGFEIIAAARRLTKPPWIIAISGGGRLASEQYLEMASTLGADATLRKPLDRLLLHAAIGARLS